MIGTQCGRVEEEKSTKHYKSHQTDSMVHMAMKCESGIQGFLLVFFCLFVFSLPGKAEAV